MYGAGVERLGTVLSFSEGQHGLIGRFRSEIRPRRWGLLSAWVSILIHWILEVNIHCEARRRNGHGNKLFDFIGLKYIK